MIEGKDLIDVEKTKQRPFRQLSPQSGMNEFILAAHASKANFPVGALFVSDFTK